MWYVYTVEYYSAIKKKEILAFSATWMDMEGIMWNKWNKSDRERQILYGITYMWNLENTTTSEYNIKEAESQIQRAT